jgi:hypothetical protein
LPDHGIYHEKMAVERKSSEPNVEAKFKTEDMTAKGGESGNQRTEDPNQNIEGDAMIRQTLNG